MTATHLLRPPAALATLALLGLWGTACDGGGGPSCDVQPTVADLETAYFGMSCTFSSCHSNATAVAGLDLSEGNAWAALVDVPSQMAPTKTLVVPGDPDASFIVQKVEGTHGEGEGGIMPQGATGVLDPGCRVQALRDWIAAGAPDRP